MLSGKAKSSTGYCAQIMGWFSYKNFSNRLYDVGNFSGLYDTVILLACGLSDTVNSYLNGRTPIIVNAVIDALPAFIAFMPNFAAGCEFPIETNEADILAMEARSRDIFLKINLDELDPAVRKKLDIPIAELKEFQNQLLLERREAKESEVINRWDDLFYSVYVLTQLASSITAIYNAYLNSEQPDPTLTKITDWINTISYTVYVLYYVCNSKTYKHMMKSCKSAACSNETAAAVDHKDEKAVPLLQSAVSDEKTSFQPNA